MNLYQPTITGSLSVSGSVNISGSITIAGGGTISGTASYATNAELLDGLDSTAFTLTSSFAAQTASFTAFTASILAQTASLNTFSASVLSYTSSLNAKTSSFATTGSNTFAGIQTINSNLTVTGSITAQTLIVSTINATQSYSSGSNIFGNASSNTQTFTGSINITGSSHSIIGNTTITAGPGATLQLIKSSTSIPNITLTGANYDSYIDGGNYLAFGTSGSYRLYINDSGSIGIGTSSPAYLFDITKESDSNTSLAYIKNTAAGRPAYLSFKSPAYNFVTGIKNDVGYVIANNDGTISSNAQINFCINSSGNVGIGTSSPSNKLEVIVASSNSGASTSGIAISDGAANRTLMFLGVNTAGYTYIQSNQDNVSSRPLVLNGSGGNVLIGSATDNGSKLQVNGTVNIGNATGGSGYQFYVRTGTDQNLRIVDGGGDGLQVAVGTDGFVAYTKFQLGGGWLKFASTGAATFSSTVRASGAMNMNTVDAVYNGSSATTTIFTITTEINSHYLVVGHDPNSTGIYAAAIVIVNGTGNIANVINLGNAGGLSWTGSFSTIQMVNSAASANGRSSLIRMR
jgi:hypothetical protein